jgi:hypothetical protein
MPYFNNDTELTAEWDFVNQGGDSVCYIASKIKTPRLTILYSRHPADPVALVADLRILRACLNYQL